MPTNIKSPVADSPPVPGEHTRALVSLLLFIHLFIVFVCLAANLIPSELEMRLLRLFQPYSQLLNLDLDGTRYFLTHATELDVDHRWEVLPAGPAEGDERGWQVVRQGVRGGERYLRYQRFADVMAYSEENDEITSLLAEGVARHYLRQTQIPLRELRCRRHSLPAFVASFGSDAAADADGPAYFSDLYRAQVLAAENGPIRVLKREAPSLEAAVKPRGSRP